MPPLLSNPNHVPLSSDPRRGLELSLSRGSLLAIGETVSGKAPAIYFALTGGPTSHSFSANISFGPAVSSLSSTFSGAGWTVLFQPHSVLRCVPSPGGCKHRSILLSDLLIYWDIVCSIEWVPLALPFHSSSAEHLDWLAAHREHPLDTIYTMG